MERRFGAGAGAEAAEGGTPLKAIGRRTRNLLVPCILVLAAGRAAAGIEADEWHRTAIHGHPIFYAMQGRGPTLAAGFGR